MQGNTYLHTLGAVVSSQGVAACCDLLTIQIKLATFQFSNHQTLINLNLIDFGKAAIQLALHKKVNYTLIPQIK